MVAIRSYVFGLSLLLTHGVLGSYPCDELGQCVEEEHRAVFLLQGVAKKLTRTRRYGRSSFLNKSDDAAAAVSLDEHGNRCFMCFNPQDTFPERCDRTYDIRHDCGNQSIFDHPELSQVPLIDFSIPANDTYKGTNAWCELNLQKVCADTLVNRDFLMMPKSMRIPPEETWDPEYCRLNGWLTPEFRALQHDFDGMQAATDELCNTKYLKYGWNSTLTYDDLNANTTASINAGVPGLGEAEYTAAWNCAMGKLGCDVSYCVYTYCVKDNGKVGMYEECEGWDPVRGMPV